jgi:hypothetical protein
MSGNMESVRPTQVLAMKTHITLHVGKELVREFDVTKIGIKDFDALTPVHQYLLDKVLTTTIMDVHADVTVKELGFDAAAKQSAELVDKKIESLYNGEFRVGGGGRVSDPVTNRLWDMFMDSEKAKMKAKYGVQKNWPKGELDRNIEKTIAANPMLREKVKASLAAEAEMLKDVKVG